MRIERFVVNPFQENCYVVSDDSKECVIIDCGAFFKEERSAIVDYIDKNGLKPQHLLCTHAHIDHCLGNNTIYEHYGLKPEVHGDDEQLIDMLPQQSELLMQYRLDYQMPPVGRYFTERDTIVFGKHKFSIIHTPGHTQGCVFFYCEEEKTAFSGDTLFRMSVGRTDLPTGNHQALMQSLHKVLTTLPHDTTVLCGHGPQTTIADELAMNPYYMH